MGSNEGALADPVTRVALRRAGAEAAAMVVVGLGCAIGVAVIVTGSPAPDDGRTQAVATAALAAVLAVSTLVAGVRSVGRLARARRLLRAHRWHPWVLKAAYPDRRTIAVATEADAEEHLIRLDRWGARSLGRHRRHLPVYLAGEDRWWVITPVEGRRRVILGRMDVPYRRFRLINPGAAPDRFDRVDDAVDPSGTPGQGRWTP